ncbi:MAG: hypothetical protein IT237_08005 [Bacteroidia bacterium]|nr:hypothetical protein [Bacteroidia bacterium]
MNHTIKFCIVILVITTSALAQDTIHFINKNSLATKISEIGINEVKYHRFDNIEGPLYISNKSEIRYIKFANGAIDTITSSITVAASSPTITYHSSYPANIKPNPLYHEKIDIRGARLYYSGKQIGEMKLKKLVLEEPDVAKRTTMLNQFKDMNRYKVKQYVFGFSGLAVSIVAPFVGLITSAIISSTSYANYTPATVGLGLGIAAGTTGLTLSIINKKKRTHKKIEIAETYNK